jgi:hypothetical protein
MKSSYFSTGLLPEKYTISRINRAPVFRIRHKRSQLVDDFKLGVWSSAPLANSPIPQKSRFAYKRYEKRAPLDQNLYTDDPNTSISALSPFV